MRYRLLLLLFISFVTAGFAQPGETDITGLWKGTLYNDTTGKYYQYEIGISEEKGKLYGFSHTWFILDDKQFFGVKKVKVKRINGKIVVEDNGLISNNYPVSPAKGVRQLNILDLDTKDSIMSLTGPFTTNATKDFRPLTGRIELYRKNDFWQSALVPHLKELGLENELSFVKAVADEEAEIRRRQLLAVNEGEQKKIQEAQQAQRQAKAREELARKQAKEKEQLTADLMAKQKAATEKAEKELAKQQAAETAAAKKLAEEEEKTAVAEAKKVARTQQEKEKAFAKQQAEAQKIIQKQIAEKEKLAKQLEKEQAIELQQAATALAKKQQQEEKLAAQQEKEQIAKQVAAEKAIAGQTAALVRSEKQAAKVPQPKINAAPGADVNERATIVQQIVNFSSDSLQLTLYDNGEVDGDTVSVIMNGNIILARQGLSTNAIKKTIYIPQNTDTVTLLMYAESLGTIPPNTGLLVVRDGKDLYEIRFSGDLEKNAAIIFRRKKQ